MSINWSSKNVSLLLVIEGRQLYHRDQEHCRSRLFSHFRYKMLQPWTERDVNC